MLLEFTKMQALGNDFIVLDNRGRHINLTCQQWQDLADRHFGIGCDQILIVEQADTADVDFGYRIVNADGSEVAQCGNGARCFARYVRERGLIDRDHIRVKTQSGRLELFIEEEQVRVDMGVPEFNPKAIPVSCPQEAGRYQIALADQLLTFGAVALGNPHISLLVNDIEQAAVGQLGLALQHRREFPEGVNVGFMQVLDRRNIKLRVYERGVGETLACGSGACAAVAIARKQDLLAESVWVHLPGGRLRVQWQQAGTAIFLTGPAEFVFNGQIQL